MRTTIKRVFNKLGYDLRKIPDVDSCVPDRNFYAPLFSPWLGYGQFKALLGCIKPYTLVSADRCYVLYSLASQALSLEGDIWECGVYKGGTAILFSELIASKKQTESKLHLFDTFQGMPETHPEKDMHRKGDFKDTSLSAVQNLVGKEDLVCFHEGLIPDTFAGLEDSKISFAHIDVDIYQSVLDCCEFIMERLAHGGFMVFDDYGFPSCPGAREAVDEFFRERQEKPLVLPTGQAIVFNSFKSSRLNKNLRKT
jgi:O-methyltransferase